ncbi:unnamed protein product, partial [Strongylus vulgaris]
MVILMMSFISTMKGERTITAKTPLGTSILDGDDVALCRFFDSQGTLHFDAAQEAVDGSSGSVHPQPNMHPAAGDSPYESSPLQSCDVPQNGADPEHFTPLPSVALPSSAGKSCLRSKPPQVFVEQPPLIGRSVPPPAPGASRNT